MNMNQDQQPSGPERLRTMVGWLVFVSSALAVSVEVFLHRNRTFGERYIGLQAAAVFLVVPIYSLFWEGHDLVPLTAFLGMFFLMCLAVRVCVTLRRRGQGPREHSRYTGSPRFMRLLPWVREETVKGIVEPVFVFLCGALLMEVNQPLGSYLMLASAGLLVWVRFNVTYGQARAMDMYDAYLEQRQLAERFRDMREK